MFLFSWITGTSVFVPRYLFLSLPGAAFLATMMVAPFLPNHAWRPLAALVGVGVLLSLGSWPRPSPQHHGSQWREAAIAINEIRSMRADTPVLCPSPFVEAQPPAWSPAYSISGFLYSHLQAYPVRGRIYPFPCQTSPEAEAYAASLAKGVLPAAGEFVIYGGKGSVLFWRDWFLARPELWGWRSRTLGSFGDVGAVLFEKRESPKYLHPSRLKPMLTQRICDGERKSTQCSSLARAAS